MSNPDQMQHQMYSWTTDTQFNTNDGIIMKNKNKKRMQKYSVTQTSAS